MFVTRRHHARMDPGGPARRARATTSAASIARMLRGVLLALAAGRRSLAGRSETLPASRCRSLLLWLAAPAVAWRISQTPPRRPPSPTCRTTQQRELRLIARRTWRFFETFVTAEDNHLPPDNFQEDPRAVVAHRTSPTNIGLYLLSIVAARDFGWCGLRDALDRIEATLDTHGAHARDSAAISTTGTTPRTCGRSIRATFPRSTRGNLAAHLITLAGAFREWQQTSATATPEAIAGLADALDLAREALREFQFTPGQTITREHAGNRVRRSRSRRCGRRDRRSDPAGRRSARRRGTRLDAGRPGAHAGARSRTRTAATTCVYWVGSHAPHHRQLAQRPAGTRSGRDSSSNTSSRWPTPRSSSRAPWSSASCSTRSASCCPSAIAPPTARSIRSCYDLLASEARLASFVAIAKGDMPARHWFRLGRTVTPDRRRRGAGVLVGLDVRVPDAGPGAARAGRQSAGADQPARREAPDRVRRGAGPALGRLRVRIQRARPRAHLPVLELRRTGPGPEARTVARTRWSRPTPPASPP